MFIYTIQCYQTHIMNKIYFLDLLSVLKIEMYYSIRLIINTYLKTVVIGWETFTNRIIENRLENN